MPGGPRSSPLLQQQMADSASANTSARRMMEECETAKSKLVDQKFTMKQYPDPLLPRDKDTSKVYPQGVTPDMEQRWLKMINDSKQ
ncbi:hypothetical protein G7Z17_g11189 [Cylindrodendrum hubeiense]|uniref:Uncharacterized protein n=1 Tax=Cylindrodendrum hubeiense TaxID=595255 RepID=A0A9P5H3E3_9HYPO|nr:hypothetical protein G7Z17_g11189 [Cylindrodendrum hubeiense]